MVTNAKAVEAAGLGGLGEVADVAEIQHEIGRWMNLGDTPVMDHANKFDGHDVRSFVNVAAGASRCGPGLPQPSGRHGALVVADQPGCPLPRRFS
jgi:hypothetical protein